MGRESTGDKVKQSKTVFVVGPSGTGKATWIPGNNFQ